MKTFAKLYKDLSSTTSTNEKARILQTYLENEKPENAIYAIYFLSKQKIKKNTTSQDLKQWCMETTNTPKWLFQECYSAVGDLAETISLLLQRKQDVNLELHELMESFKKAQQSEKFVQKNFFINYWNKLSQTQILLLNKIITRGYRVGVSKKTVVKAIANMSKANEQVIMQRMLGKWEPTKEFFDKLMQEKTKGENLKKPYPFYLASKLESTEEKNEEDYIAEYKWDGIRIQLIKRQGQVTIWTRRGDLITNQFTDLKNLGAMIPVDFVIDGELVIKKRGTIQSFNALQKRLGRKKPSLKTMGNLPAHIICYDLLEHNGKDIRKKPLIVRRKQLHKIVNKAIKGFQTSTKIRFTTWKDLDAIRKKAREKNAEGLMLKRKMSTYKHGRKKGDWWKWKLPPHTIDTVLLYAEPGRGRRASLYTDYTLGVWHNNELLPIAKAYSGLTDKEIEELSKWITKNTVNKYGPVRDVKKEQVIELAFDSMQESNRHKSGISLRFPRIKRWRKQKPAKEAETLQRAKQYLHK